MPKPSRNDRKKKRHFDLNLTEDLLEAWSPADAIREMIANGLDEQRLAPAVTEGEAFSEIPETEVQERAGDFDGARIRDYGRGLRYDHFTQGNSGEKRSYPDLVIGKYGVGLKDAIAVLYRHGIDVEIHSPHASFSVEKIRKKGFDDVETIHMVVTAPERPSMRGTEVRLKGARPEQMRRAKDNFLRFQEGASDRHLTSTPFGDIYAPASPGGQTSPEGESPERGGEEAKEEIAPDGGAVYVLGIQVATEPDFLFTYNITTTTKDMRDALNRERSNVGRTAYAQRVRQMLTSEEATECRAVTEALVEDLRRFEDGEEHGELGWKPIRKHAAKVANATGDFVFATSRQQTMNRDILDKAQAEGKEVVTIPTNIRADLQKEKDTSGSKVQDVRTYEREFKESYEFDWVAEEDLTPEEKSVWKRKDSILGLIGDRGRLGGSLRRVEEVRVSETIESGTTAKTRKQAGAGAKEGEHPSYQTLGLWQPEEGRIVVSRRVLSSLDGFAATLLHEAAHPRSGGATDQTRAFEDELTELLGEVAVAALTGDFK